MGRLIDEDFVKRRMHETMDYQDLYLPVHFEMCMRDAPTIAAPRWVSIDDELPKEREWVLVWHTGYATAKKALFKDRDLGGSLKFDGGGGTWVFDGWSDRGGRVTHWMPLPEPPEGAEVPTL